MPPGNDGNQGDFGAVESRLTAQPQIKNFGAGVNQVKRRLDVFTVNTRVVSGVTPDRVITADDGHYDQR
jgi:tetrahydromethanopterin S-methyltransferase subunit F